MDKELEALVWRRARDRCEYCLVPQLYDETPFEIDHIRAKKHDGLTIGKNLALSCFWCNSYKGSCIAGHDRKSRKLTSLFNPRRHPWSRHFRWRGPHLIGKTAIGRVTIRLLKINDPLRVELRQHLIDDGVFP